MKLLYSFCLLLFSCTPYWAQVISIGDTGDYLNLEAAASANAINLGDILLFQSQIFDDGTQFLYDINGSIDQPIVLKSMVQHGAIFQGGSEAIHLTRCTNIEINGFVFEQQTSNGVNIDDGGDYANVSKHITIRNNIFRDMNASGNNDLLKMSGVDSFLIEQCQFINGGAGGSGVDFVGCHYGVVQDNNFDNSGTSGIQNKGGSQFIRIQRNIFRNISQRALNLGGSTGLIFFRPPLPNPIVDAFEAADLDVFSNIFIGCWAPIAYVGAVRVNVSNNTFYQPENWVMRILQETTEPGFLPCGDNTFNNNIIYLPSDLTEVNIGPNTNPSSFTISNNLWFNASSNSWTPSLPVMDPNQIISNPLFVDANIEDYHIESISPAIASGLYQSNIVGDYDKNLYLNPPSIGAYEGDPSTTQTHIEIQATGINIYPNPSNNSVKLDGDFTDADIYILDESGNVIQDLTNINAPYTIELGSLPGGIYFIRIQSNSHTNMEVQKIIKY